MIRHIEFCLEEIECEIEAQSTAGISAPGRLSLQRNIAEMRAVLAEWQTMAGTSDIVIADSEFASGDKLALIRGIDPETANLLAAKGVTSYRTIAEWRHDDIKGLGHATLSLERIATENWIEQAAILVTGQLTLHAKRIELARIADVEVVTAAIADPGSAIDAAIAPAQTIAAAAPDRATLATTAAAASTAPAANVVALESGRTTSIGRRLAQAAAAVAILAAGIGAIKGWDLANVTAITAALAEQTKIR